MSEEEFEYWLHATDEERATIHASWDVGNDEGKDIVESVAIMLKDECVYDVLDVAPIKFDGKWLLQGIADADYESLKNRNIEFLGFKLTFIKTE